MSGHHSFNKLRNSVSPRSQERIKRKLKHIEIRLQRLAQKTEHTKTYCAREMTPRFMEDMEDECLALSRLETATKRWTLEELEKGIDLEFLEKTFSEIK